MSSSGGFEAALAARDLRTGGRWSAGQRLKNALLRALIRALLAIAGRLPESWLLALGRGAGRAASRLMLERRRIATENLARALPAADSTPLARACFENAGRNLALCLLARRPGMRVLDRVEVSSAARRTLDDALGEGNGVVFVSAHLGPFEWVAAAIAELGYPASVVVRESYDPALDPLVDAHRMARGLSVIHRGAPHAPARIARALRRGRLLGLLPDLGGRVESIAVSFLGARPSVPIGPARLAHRTAAAIVVGTLEPGEGTRHALRIERVELGRDEIETTQRVMSALETAIRRAPAHWLWMARALIPRKRGER